jgi:hypothetical protein
MVLKDWGPFLVKTDTRFPRSAWKPEPGSRRLSAGHRPASKQVPAGLLRRPRKLSAFDGSCVVFDSSSTVHLRSPSWPLPDGGTPAFSRSVHHLGSHPHAAPGGLRTGPAARPRGARPHLPCSMASVSRSIGPPFSAFVAHFRGPQATSSLVARPALWYHSSHTVSLGEPCHWRGVRTR